MCVLMCETQRESIMHVAHAGLTLQWEGAIDVAGAIANCSGGPKFNRVVASLETTKGVVGDLWLQRLLCL